MLKTIFFDAAGTLFHPRGSVGAQYREVALRHGLDFPASVFDDAFSAAWRSRPPRLQTSSARPDDDRDWWRALVFGILDRLAAPGDFLTRRELFFAELYEHFRNPAAWGVYPEVPAVLELLAQTWRLAVVSNFDGRLRDILRGCELLGHFEQIVISSEVGADKPNPAVFREALKRLGVEPEEALHVGDDPQLDWAAAKTVGIASFHLERPRNSLIDMVRQVRKEFLFRPFAA
jgi:putative hydrolase of the HAD superfamily